MAQSKEEVLKLLATAYSMEIETVLNYLANSVNLDGVRAEEIKKSLAADACYVDDELVRPQKGDFYGGWITDNFVGPFKGGPATMGW